MEITKQVKNHFGVKDIDFFLDSMNIQKRLQNRQQDQISNVLGQGTHSTLMASYKGRDSTYSKALEALNFFNLQGCQKLF